MAGADGYFWVFTRVLVLAGQPALTATALAWACRAASLVAAVVVVTLDWDSTGFLLFLPDRRKAIPTTAAAMTTTMTTLRTCRRRFWRLASSASRASLAARWRALFSLGTARDPTQSPGGPPIAPGGRWAAAPGSRPRRTGTAPRFSSLGPMPLVV